MEQLKPPTIHQRIISYFLIFCGIGLLVLSMLIPPQGEIHPSVLAAFAMILTFVGAVIGIDYKYKSIIAKYMDFVQQQPAHRTTAATSIKDHG